MNQEKIKQEALSSLHKYFKNAVDIHKISSESKNLDKDQITAMVKKQIAAEKEELISKQEALAHLEEDIDSKVEAEYSKIFGETSNYEDYHKPSVAEFEAKLMARKSEIQKIVAEEVQAKLKK